MAAGFYQTSMQQIDGALERLNKVLDGMSTANVINRDLQNLVGDPFVEAADDLFLRLAHTYHWVQHNGGPGTRALFMMTLDGIREELEEKHGRFLTTAEQFLISQQVAFNKYEACFHVLGALENYIEANP